MSPKRNLVTGRDLEGKEVTLQKSEPLQLNLFQTFLPDNGKYSNTIDFYDAVPKYYASTQKMESLREGGKYLPILKREFCYRNPSTGATRAYKVEIKPARLERDGGEREYYPTEREELVEEALRKLAADAAGGMFLDKGAGVQFTLYQLQQELKRRGHAINYPSLIDALTICNTTNISIVGDDGKAILRSTIFPVLLIASREDWLKDPKAARCFVQFNPLVTRSINTLTYRQFDYIKYMGYKRQLSRWLHKKLFHNYTQADLGNTYTIRASTIIRDSGLVNNQQHRDRIKAIDDSFRELQGCGVLLKVERIEEREGRRLLDVKFELSPSWDFVNEVKLANKRQQVIARTSAVPAAG